VSGIFGLFNLDGRPVEADELRAMQALLVRRGPDRTGIWRSGNVGLGHALLATTPEAVLETQPLEHVETGCVISGDVRLDNREELLAALGTADPAIGDAEIVLRAYLEWGEHCGEHLLGDFAFAIWDPRERRLFCARDQMGLRSLYFHHSHRQLFAFATDPRAILVIPQTPFRINEGRIADFLVEGFVGLEGVDKTSTFFNGIFRLPPAHLMTVAAESMTQRKYWEPTPESELRLPSAEAYSEAFLDVFRPAVRSRLRTVGPPASTLSGGIDSGTVTAVARRLLADDRKPPLLTFSAVSPAGEEDAETRAILAASAIGGLEPHRVSYADLPELLPDLDDVLSAIDEPFDRDMTLIRAVYLTAQRRGITTLLDAASADTIFTEGRWIAHLLRSGRWRAAYREAKRWNEFCRGGSPPGRGLLRSARSAFVPDAILRKVRPYQRRLRVRPLVRSSLISDEFARSVDLGERLEALANHSVGFLPSIGAERASTIDHPYLTVARERYDRVAAGAGVEPRDPFLDLGVVEFALRLPGEQTLRDGWPKVVLRRAMDDELPTAVCWRRGRDHLGVAFTSALVSQRWGEIRDRAEASLEAVSGYVDSGSLQAIRSALQEDDAARSADVLTMLVLGDWLLRHATRPAARLSQRPPGQILT
jgi:asparagine synthase (glutamine-hydrolysing)